MSNYKNLKIFVDLLMIYKKCLATYNNKPKIFRITVYEKMLNGIVKFMKLTVLANTKKNNKKDIESTINDLRIIYFWHRF